MAAYIPKSASEMVVAGVAAGATAFCLYAAYQAATVPAKDGDDDAEVSTTSVSKDGHALYETDKAVSEYLMFHFQDQNKDFCPYDCAPPCLDFAKRTADICSKYVTEAVAKGAFGGAKLRALDVGCAVGRSSFEMARTFDEVVGVDFSGKFINAAKALTRSPTGLGYSYTVEGTLKASGTASVPAGIDTSRCRFEEGDACALDPKALGKFHVLHAANLLCRLPKPRAFLALLPELMEDGGFVVFISPYSWLKQYTRDRNEWLGGFTDASDTAVESFPTLKAIMNKNGFTLVKEGDEPFVIREHRRKFQWGCSHLTIWQLSA